MTDGQLNIQAQARYVEGLKPLALGRQVVARKYEALLANFPNPDIVDFDRYFFRQAARLRAEYRIRPPDALQAGASLLYGAEVFITNDGLFNGRAFAFERSPPTGARNWGVLVGAYPHQNTPNPRFVGLHPPEEGICNRPG